jgi:aminotransferase
MWMPQLSQLASHIAQSEIRIMSVECEKVGGVNLAQGICDTEVPLPVRRGAEAAIEGGFNSYTRLDGIANLRRAIARKMRDDNGVEADPEHEIVVTAGSTGAFYCACMSLLNPGDEVIVFEPYYGYHVHTLEAMHTIPKYVTLTPPDWSFPRAALERAVTSKTRGVVVNSPANPSGKVFSAEELGWIAEIVRERDLVVFTDEIYEYFLYDGRRHISPATLPGMREHCVTISGFSKTFSITGWRIGYAVCDRRWAHAIGYFHDLAYICAPSPFQHGVAAGLDELEPEFYRALAAEYTVKRDLLCHALEAAGLKPNIPQGAYYVLADAAALPGTTSKQKAMYLLKETGVAAVPGDSFYNGGAGNHLLRFCFAKSDSDLREACRRLEQLRKSAVST